MSQSRDAKEPELLIRDHVYDGIEEYDQKLPNWWLFTLYGAIVFSVVYWFFFVQSEVGKSDEEQLARKLAVIETAKLEAQMELLNDDTLWQMAGNEAFVAAGRDIYFKEANCAQCHGNELEGGIGVNLVDSEWIYGAAPTVVYNTINNGARNGMPAWESLGPQKIAQVTAFVLSHHQP